MNIPESTKSISMVAVVVAVTALLLAGCDSAGAGGGGGGGGSDNDGTNGVVATTDGTSDITWEVTGSITGDPDGTDYSIAWTYTEPTPPNTFSATVFDDAPDPPVWDGTLPFSTTENNLADGTGVGLSYTALETHQASITLRIVDGGGTVLAEKSINGTVTPPDP
jgi:hypothetical protein